MKVVYCDSLKAGESICVGGLIIRSTADKHIVEEQKEVV